MIRYLLILVFIGVQSGWTQEILTLQKALEMAFENSPALIQSRIGLQRSEALLAAQKASMKSQFALEVNPFSYSRSNNFDSRITEWYTSENKNSSATFRITQPVRWTDGSITLKDNFSWQEASNQSSGMTNTSFNNKVSLSIYQPLFTYNRSKMEMKEVEYSLENARLSHAMQQLNIEKSVTSVFYSVYQSYKNLQIARDEFENQGKNYEIIKNKSEAGLVGREEFFQAEVNYATAKFDVLNREIDYANRKDDFKLQLGMPLDVDFTVLANTEVFPVEVNSDEAVKNGLNRRMELRQKEIAIERSVFDIIRTKANSEFKGNISAEIGLFGNNEKFRGIYDRPTDNQQIGVTLTVPLWDWGVKKTRVRSAELGKESLEIGMEEEKREIIVNIRQICRNLPMLSSQIEIARQNVKNAEDTYTIYLEKYRNGTINGMNLQQYQTQLTNARQSITNALIRYKLELLNLKIQTLWDFEKAEGV